MLLHRHLLCAPRTLLRPAAPCTMPVPAGAPHLSTSGSCPKLFSGHCGGRLPQRGREGAAMLRELLHSRKAASLTAEPAWLAEDSSVQTADAGQMCSAVWVIDRAEGGVEQLQQGAADGAERAAASGAAV